MRLARAAAIMMTMHADDSMRMTIRLTVRNREVLGAGSRLTGKSMSQVIDEALELWLSSQPKKIREAANMMVDAVAATRKKP